jgi:hypothetical protein
MAGCTIPSPHPSEGTRQPVKNGDGGVRHDVRLLTDRIPALAEATGATWSSGTLGDERTPGPSTYWIDAVVWLPAPAADQLRAELALSPTATTPTLVPAVNAALPAGELLVGKELDQRYSGDGWHSTAYLTRGGSVLVLNMVGGN